MRLNGTEVKVFEGISVVYERTMLKRGAMCSCGCGERVVVGEREIAVEDPKQINGRHFKYQHFMNGDAEEYHHDNEYNSITCDNHELMIIAPMFEVAYFGSHGLKCYACNKTHRRFVGNYTNGYTSGHIVNTALEHGYTVRINGNKVNTFEEYLRAVGK